MLGRLLGPLILVFIALPLRADAQQFSFGFASGGGGHHHHHHGCYGGGWGFSIYRPPLYAYPPSVVYAPPPVTYVYPAPAVQVVQPAVPAFSQSQLSPQASSVASRVSSGSAVQLNSLPASRERSDVVLRNPAENAGPVAFRVQDQVDAELGPGMTRTWSDRTSLAVEFDRGGDFGATRKILRPGAYEFIVTESGWDLVAAVAPAASSRSASLQRNTLPRK